MLFLCLPDGAVPAVQRPPGRGRGGPEGGEAAGPDAAAGEPAPPGGQAVNTPGSQNHGLAIRSSSFWLLNVSNLTFNI